MMSGQGANPTFFNKKIKYYMNKTLANPPFAISPQKLFSFTRYLSFCLDFLVMYQNGFIKKKIMT